MSNKNCFSFWSIYCDVTFLITHWQKLIFLQFHADSQQTKESNGSLGTCGSPWSIPGLCQFNGFILVQFQVHSPVANPFWNYSPGKQLSRNERATLVLLQDGSAPSKTIFTCTIFQPQNLRVTKQLQGCNRYTCGAGSVGKLRHFQPIILWSSVEAPGT